MEKAITSISSVYKLAKSLKQKKNRQQTGYCLAEGIHIIGQAVESSTPIHSIFYAPSMLKSQYALSLIEAQKKLGIPCYECDEQRMQTLAEKENPQGIVAVVAQKKTHLEGFTPSTFSWGVVLINPQDAGNVGTILRTCDAVGAAGCIITEPCVDRGNPTLIRASMGAVFFKPLIITTFTQLVEWAFKHGYHIIGTSAHAQSAYDELSAYPKPLLVMFGSEKEGLTAEHTRICEQMVRLPMHGKTTSLNLSVSVGVILYDILQKDRLIRQS